MKTTLHILLGLIQLALALPFLVPALWYLYTGEVIFAFTNTDWSSASAFEIFTAGVFTMFHLAIEELF